jgi:hypothetical protein
MLWSQTQSSDALEANAEQPMLWNQAQSSPCSGTKLRAAHALEPNTALLSQTQHMLCGVQHSMAQEQSPPWRAALGRAYFSADMTTPGVSPPPALADLSSADLLLIVLLNISFQRMLTDMCEINRHTHY